MLKFSPLILTGVSALKLQSQNANPIRKIINLLEKTQTELTAEGVKAEEHHKKLNCKCEKEIPSLEAQIKKNQEEATRLMAASEAANADGERLKKELADHRSDRKEAEESQKAAAAARSKEAEQYVKEESDARNTVNGLTKAVKLLSRGGGESLVQLQKDPKMTDAVQEALDHSVSVSSSDKDVIVSFLMGKATEALGGAGSVDEIIGILKQMLEEATKELNDIVSKEEQAVNDFKALSAAKQDQIKAAGKSIESKQGQFGKLTRDASENKVQAVGLRKDAEAGQVSLQALKKQCKDAGQNYAKNTKARNDELQAVSDTIGILDSDENREALRNMKGMAGNAFVQTAIKADSAKRAENAIKNLPKFSEKQQNKLALISSMIKVNANSKVGKVDFSKVIKMIDDMVKILKQEQTADEHSRETCTKNLNKNDAARKDNQNALDGLSATVEELEGKIADTKEAISKANDEIKELDQNVADSTENRKSENADFTKNVMEQKLVMKILAQAKNRLEQFYRADVAQKEKKQEQAGENKEGTALVQVGEVSEHRQAAGNNAVFAMLDKFLNEAKTTITEDTNEEQNAQEDYEEFMKDSAEQRSSQQSNIKAQQGKKATAEGDLVESKNDQRLQLELGEDLRQSNKDLHGECDFVMANFESRRDARNEEIDGLKVAKSALQGADV